MGPTISNRSGAFVAAGLSLESNRTMAQHTELLEAADADPGHWLGATALMDLEDPKLRLRVRALTQLCRSDREKALVVYGFVKRMPLEPRFSVRARTARAVYDAGRGSASEKATLLVAMLRIAGIPARLRYVTHSGELLRGIAGHLREVDRPLLEVRLDGRWQRTDTYLLDVDCLAAARQRLQERGWEWGYGMHVGGAKAWNGLESAYLGGVPTECDLMVVRQVGVVHDETEYRALRRIGGLQRLLRRLHWSLLAPVARHAWRRPRPDQRPASVHFHETY